MWSMRTLLGSDNYLLDIALYENNEGIKRPEVYLLHLALLL